MMTLAFRNLPLAKKLGVAFGAVLLIIAISSAIIMKQTRGLAETERLKAASDTVLNLVDQLIADAAMFRGAGYKLIISGDKSDGPAFDAAKEEFNKDFKAAKAILDRDAPQFAEKFADARNVVVEGYFNRFLERQVKFASDLATHQQAVASVISKPSQDAREAYEAKMGEFRTVVSGWSDDLTAEANSAMASTEWIVGVSGLVTFLVGVAMAWLVARSIGVPLNLMTKTMRMLASGDNRVDVPARGQTDEIGQMAGAVQVLKEAAVEKLRLEAAAVEAQRAAEVERTHAERARAVAAQQQAQVVEGIASGLTKLASGDLLQSIDRPFAPEYESLRADFNATVLQLQKTIQDVSTSTGTIQSGTGEISNASDELSRRTELQAASLEETAAALAEITGALQKTSEGASHARTVVGVAESTADNSQEVIGRTIEAMGNIEKSSQHISQIIGVIDEIAFQTNLLALNAGVEAARAGESGRGFAVVASEVRALAQRCAEAAKEVKTLVRSSDDQVKLGVELVAESGKMLGQIVMRVKELRTIVDDIAGSAQQQAAGLSEVNIAIRQMDQVTQQNAAMAEEATAAAHNLAQEGSELKRLVGQFSIGGVVRAVPAVKKHVSRILPGRAAAGGAMRAKST